MKQSITLRSAGPFLLLTFIYFIVGFLTTVNGQCQGPLKIAFLSEVTTTKNSLATLISFAFFLGYLLNSAKTGRLLNKVGYKKIPFETNNVVIIIYRCLDTCISGEYNCTDKRKSGMM